MGTRETILLTALDLIQARGLNAFSYRDISAQVGIRTASIHHHFPSKEDLAREAITLYRKEFLRKLHEITKHHDSADEEWNALVNAMAESLQSGKKVCLCVMMMSDSHSLQPETKAELALLIQDVESWLALLLEKGKQAGELHFPCSSEALATALFSGLQGLMICARSKDSPQIFLQSADALFSVLKKA